MLVSLIDLLRVLHAKYLTLCQNFQTSKKLWDRESVRENAFALLDFYEYFESFWKISNFVQKSVLALSLPDILLLHERGLAFLLPYLQLESVDIHRNHLIVSRNVSDQIALGTLWSILCISDVKVVECLIRSGLILKRKSHLLFGRISIFIEELTLMSSILCEARKHTFGLAYSGFDFVKWDIFPFLSTLRRTCEWDREVSQLLVDGFDLVFLSLTWCQRLFILHL